jgi:putative transposase
MKSSAMLTQWKKEENLQFLSEVSCFPLEQGLRHLQATFGNFFAWVDVHPPRLLWRLR